MTLLQNIGYILIGFIALVSIFLIILTFLEKKLRIRFMEGKYARNEFYIKKIAAIDLEKPRESLKILDNLAKSFFKEAFHISRAIEDSEFENFFIQKNNKKAVEFTDEMTKYLYSREEVTKEKLKELAILLAEIIGSNRIISKDEKEDLDKKSQDLEHKKKSNIPLVGKFIKSKESSKKNPKNNKPEDKGNPFKAN